VGFARRADRQKTVKSTPFPEKNGKVPFNASGVVQVGQRRFVFIDNNDSAIFEFALDTDGTKVKRIRRRQLVGVSKDQLRDPEGLTRVEFDGSTYLIAASSLCVAGNDRSGRPQVNDGLVRVRYTPAGDLHAEAMSGFRSWLLTHEPSLAEAGELEPDAGGLNIEGLAWDPRTSALFLGQRGPAKPGQITIIRIPVDAGAARWTTASLKAPAIVRARVPESRAKQGIRDISYDEETGDFLMLLGRSVSRGKSPFQLCIWNTDSDDVTLIDVAFHRSMKPEGITTFARGDKKKILLVDDAGGYAVLPSQKRWWDRTEGSKPGVAGACGSLET